MLSTSLGLDESEIDDQWALLGGPSQPKVLLAIRGTKIKGPDLPVNFAAHADQFDLDESEVSTTKAFPGGFEAENLSLDGAAHGIGQHEVQFEEFTGCAG